MIFINRNQQDENGKLIVPNNNWFTKAEAATQDAINDPENHQFNTNLYGHDSVRAALEKLFHDKCAYCESPLEGHDAEHFRPKGRVAENRHHPGYYWLVYEWKNLYPSCIHCNQRRKDKPRWGDLKYGITGGKLDQFPLEDENTRAMTPEDDIKLEKNLLLDPCNDDPSLYLTFGIDGQILSIDNNDRGNTTIEICHLTRRRLKDKRKVKVSETIELVKLIKKLENAGQNCAAQELSSFMEKNFLADGCHFAAVSRSAKNNPDAFDI